MRDIALTLFVFGSIPFILRQPWIGVLEWVWVGVMNPNRLAWGFAWGLPFAQVIALATLGGLLFTKEKHRFPWTRVTILLILFILWMNVSTLVAINFSYIYAQWDKVMKIMFMTLVLLYTLDRPKQFKWLVWVLVVSVGFYGVKGGIFTLLTGGDNRVWGPSNSYIEDNNALAVAICMTMPLAWYLRMQSTNLWVRVALLCAILLCAVSVLGSYSRGALLTIAAMSSFLWLKSRYKVVLGALTVVVAIGLAAFMPGQWYARMDSISNYRHDNSALGRLNAWQMAINLAKDRPLTGGGFEIYDPATFAKYAPDPTDVHAAHSIYFSALGEHGYVGLLLYLLLGFFAWRDGAWIVKRCKGAPELRWAADLALMCQVSIVGFAVGGAFLSLLYFDVPYYIVALLVLVRRHVAEALAQAPSVPSRESPAVAVGGSRALPIATGPRQA